MSTTECWHAFKAVGSCAQFYPFFIQEISLTNQKEGYVTVPWQGYELLPGLDIGGQSLRPRKLCFNIHDSARELYHEGSNAGSNSAAL